MSYRTIRFFCLMTLLMLSYAPMVYAGQAKNVIIMIPDGMGLADVTAARIYKNGANGEPLSFETLERIGYQRTCSANSTITDSAAAASAWACGEKFNNGELCLHGDGRPHKPSILELAKQQGKKTGLIATSTITNATPAAFGAHVAARNCEQEVARQYITVTGVDLLLGGGAEKFNAAKRDKCGTKGDFIRKALERGYAVVYSKSELDQATADGVGKILGLFNVSNMTPVYQRPSTTPEPRLAEMTAAALKILEKDDHGFFLMVEGSQVDWANHSNNLAYQLGEVLAFDEAVSVVRQWLNADEARKKSTLLIVVADHETGGFAVTGPKSILPGTGRSVEAGWTGHEHTGVDTIIWSEGPGSENLGKAIDNTDIYRVMVQALQ